MSDTPTKTRKTPKLHLLPEHVETKTYPLSSKKAEELQNVIAKRGGIIAGNLRTIIFPTKIEDKRMHFLQPEEFEIAVVFNRSKQLTGITLAQAGKQWTVTSTGIEPTHYTLSGDGVGTLVTKGRSRALEALLGSEPMADSAREFLRGRCAKEAK